MATTNLIADFLIIGVCSLIWILPAAQCLTGIKLAAINDLGLAPSFAILGAIYVVGICINRFADDVTGPFNDKIRKKVFPPSDTGPPYHTRLNAIVARSESAANYLSYRRSIVRITRACAVNFLLGALAWIILLGVRLVRGDGTLSPIVAGTVAGVCVLVTILLMRAWPVVLQGYFSSIRDMHQVLLNQAAGN